MTQRDGKVEGRDEDGEQGHKRSRNKGLYVDNGTNEGRRVLCMASPWEGSGFPGVRGWSAGERCTEERLAPLNLAAFAREEHLQRGEDQALPAV